MRKTFCAILLFISLFAHATNWNFTGQGYWNQTNLWPNGYPGTTVNAGDTVFITPASICYINTNITINGVLVITQNTCLVKNTAPVTVNNGSIINKAGTFNIQSPLVFNNGILQSNGQINISSSTSMSFLGTFTNSGVFSNYGVFQLTGTIQNTQYGNLVNYSSFTVAGTISSKGGFYNDNGGTVTISQLFQSDGGGIDNAGTMNIASGGTLYNNASSTFTNSGTINNSYLLKNGGNFTNSGNITSIYSINNNRGGQMTNTGKITLNAGNSIPSTLSVSGTFTNSNIVYVTPGTQILNNDSFYNGAIISNIGTVENYGKWIDAPRSLFTSLAIVNNFGYFEENGSFDDQGTFENDSTLLIGQGIFNIGSGNTLLNKHRGTCTINFRIINGGIITMADSSVMENNMTFYNQGKITLETKSIFRNTHFVQAYTNSSIDNGGTIVNSGYMGIQGIFTTRGLISNGAVFVVNVAQFTISGTFSNLAGGTFYTYDIPITINADGIFDNNGDAGFTILTPNNIKGKNKAFRPGTNIVNNGIINNNAHLTNDLMLSNFNTINNTGTFTNNGTWGNNTNATINNMGSGTILNAGGISNVGTINASATGLINFFKGSISGYTQPFTNYQITQYPSYLIIPVNGSGQLLVLTLGPDVSYQWQVSIDNGATWNNISDDGNYSGSTTQTLQFTNIPITFTGYQYRVNVSAPQPGNAVNTPAIVLTVTSVKKAKK